MPLFVDGVEINSVFVDGIEQTEMYVDGVLVFSSGAALPTLWSGDSICQYYVFGSPDYHYGWEVSGTSFNYYGSEYSVIYYGAVSNLSEAGWSVGSLISGNTIPQGIKVSGFQWAIYTNAIGQGAWLNYDLGTYEWSGLSTVTDGSYIHTIETSGGLMRRNGSNGQGAAIPGSWVSLT